MANQKQVNDKTPVFYFSGINFDSLYQRPQQLFREWRSNFADMYEFYYVEYPQITRCAARYLRRLKGSLDMLLLDRQNKNEADAFVLTLPAVSRSFLGHRVPKRISQGDLAFKVIDVALRRTLDKRCGNVQRKVAIVASPLWEPFISKDDFDLLCYDYLDPVELFEPSVDVEYSSVQEQHRKLVAKSDIIFVTAQNLKDDVLTIAGDKEVVMVSNGTDADFFERNKASHEIADYTKTNRKTVGFVGHYLTVDLDLIYAVARELPGVDVLLIGPFQRERRVYKRPNNVFILGRKEYKQIPAYIEIFDVALIPFKPSAVADSIDPVKLYEYFSLGKPVVATGLRELEKFDDGQLLRIAETPDKFVEAIKAFLEYDEEAWREARRQVARQNSWLSKATLIMSSIETRINESQRT